MKNGKRSATVFVIDGISQCCGAIDGKHVLINAPDEGRIRWVFQNCSLLELLENGLLPTGSFLVGDNTFPLKPYLMKAYKKYNRPLTQEESIFNYRLSRARRIIENVFGILLSRFRFLDRKLAVNLRTVNKLVSAACALHNWLVITSKATYLSAGAIDEECNETGEIIPGRWRSEIRVLRDLEKYGHRTRELSKRYGTALKRTSTMRTLFPWQYEAIFGTSLE
jgi:hypothetical protein